jgi:replicative DNA helicase
MKSVQSPLVKAPRKAPTGIAGFDEITGGGLPRGRTTLLVGRSGTGKTVLALQFLVRRLTYFSFDLPRLSSSRMLTPKTRATLCSTSSDGLMIARSIWLT